MLSSISARLGVAADVVRQPGPFLEAVKMLGFSDSNPRACVLTP